MTKRSFMELLVTPWVDKAIAILAAVPLAVELYRRWVAGHMSFSRAVLGLQLLVLIVLMVLRTTPVRVTPNPWFWLLAFVTSDGPLGFTAYAGQGVALVPPMVGNGLAVVSVIVLVYALLSLGRNIGFIPTLRKIVTRGACRFVRHPIYTGTFVSFLAFVLRGFSVLNLTVATVLVALLMIRSVAEERFLQEDAGYAPGCQETKSGFADISAGSPLALVARHCLSGSPTTSLVFRFALALRILCLSSGPHLMRQPWSNARSSWPPSSKLCGLPSIITVRSGMADRVRAIHTAINNNVVYDVLPMTCSALRALPCP